MKAFMTLALALTATSAIAARDTYNLPLKKEVKFTRACEEGQLYVIAGVGDILLHGPLQKKAADKQSFVPLWEEVLPYINGTVDAPGPDIAYANLEGPAADGVDIRGRSQKDPGFVFNGKGESNGVNDDKKIYTTYPRFNYYPELIPNLKESGFDILSTANNHSLDRFSLGADRTVEQLVDAEMPFIGTRKSDETESERPWVRVISKKGLSTAWISCTFSTNGVTDSKGQVFDCYKSKPRLLELVKEYSAKVDAVIVTPHWGDEYYTQPLKNQVGLGRDIINAGAMAIIGNHPHVLQPMEKVTTANGREGFIIYSLGNFISNQTELNKRASGILYLGITKNKRGTFLNGVKLLPTYMINNSGMDALRLTVIPKAKKDSHEAAKHTRGIFADTNLVWGGEEIDTNDHCPTQG